MSKTTHVIVIDDDILQLESYRRILEAEGFNVKTCPDTYEAIDNIDETTDVILTDVLLGYNTVFPLFNELQSQSGLCEIPIVVCSDVAESLPAGSMSIYGVSRILDKSKVHTSDIVAALRGAQR